MTDVTVFWRLHCGICRRQYWVNGIVADVGNEILVPNDLTQPHVSCLSSQRTATSTHTQLMKYQQNFYDLVQGVSKTCSFNKYHTLFLVAYE